MTQGQISEPKAALSFILAGKATVTLRSLMSGNRYTYKIVAAEKRNPNDAPTWFVKLLNGPDNTNSFVYIGIIRNNQLVWTSKSRVAINAPSFIGFKFVLNALIENNMHGFEVWHEGRCGRCGKKLTVPESVATGFGPNCLELVGGMAAVIASGVAASNPIMDDNPQSDKKFLAAFAEPLVPTQEIGIHAATDSGRVQNGGELDAMIRARIAAYKSEAPENYYQDGELDEKQAYNVAYNMFRVQVEREGRS